MLDVAIRGGTVVDGLGGSSVLTDVGIKDGRIAALGRPLGRARGSIDAGGCIVAPGFIDIHTHSDFTLPVRPAAEAKLRQGVTTDVTGNCGFSPFPLGADDAARLHGDFFEPGLVERWAGLASYADALTELNPGINVAPLVGLGAVRLAVMGEESGPAGPGQRGRMRKHVERAMDDGAFGVSSGLVYPPGCYADLEELADLAAPAGAAGGIYATHLRNEASFLEDALEEALAVGRRADCPVHVSHHKAVGRSNHGCVQRTLGLIDEANRDGQDVTLDAYPYTAGSSTLMSVVPARYQAGGVEALRRRLAAPDLRTEIAKATRTEATFDLEQIVLASVPSRPELAARPLAEAAADDGTTPEELALRLIEVDGAAVVSLAFGMAEEDVRAVLAHPHCSVGSDGWVMSADAEPHPHPRNLSYTARLLGRYVRDERVLSLTEAIRKLSALPADRLRLQERGRIVAGAVADLVVLDLEQLRDHASYTAPCRYPGGIEWVLLAGRIAVEAGELTGVRAGRVLVRAGSGAASR
jgi:N-acyl-D-amino-acid deacylase